MSDFKFLKIKTGKWVVLDAKRAERPDEAEDKVKVCPFCPGNEQGEIETYRIGGEPHDPNWQVRVVENKYPFAPIHEIIIHSPDHHKNFGELPVSQAELVLKAYKNRFNEHKNRGHVYIFQNHGEEAGESVAHPHSQLVVVEPEVNLDIRPLEDYSQDHMLAKEQFVIFSPATSEFGGEVWIAPHERDKFFWQIRDVETAELAQILTDIINAFSSRLGHEFPFNWYIYPGTSWYLRLIPRKQKFGGFEIGTGIHVNQEDPGEVIKFLKKSL